MTDDQTTPRQKPHRIQLTLSTALICMVVLGAFMGTSFFLGAEGEYGWPLCFFSLGHSPSSSHMYFNSACLMADLMFWLGLSLVAYFAVESLNRRWNH